jgi:cobalt/nickel transport system permease protein
MHVHFLDPYRPRRSAIHQMDARVKFVWVLAFILTTSLVPAGAWPAYILLLSIVVAVELLSELGIGYVLRRAVLALPFVLAALPVVFTVGGTPLFQVSVGPWTLTASVEGLERFASIALKSWISVQAAIILAATTPFPDLLVAMRAVRVPRLLVAIFGLMWRYLFVLADEALRLLRARAARSGVTGRPELKPGGGLAWRARVTGGMGGNLFLRGFERCDRIYMAMLARGYDGEVRSVPLPRLSRGNLAILTGSLVIFALLLALAVLL